MSRSARFYGPIPSVGERVRHFHPWIDDFAVGTVARIEPLGSQFRRGPFTFERCRIHLTECEHWDSNHEWGPAPDTYFDNLSESWEYAERDGGPEGLVAPQPHPRTDDASSPAVVD